MSLVRFGFDKPTPDGDTAPALGRVQCVPSRERVVQGSPDRIIVPAPFTVPIPASGSLNIPLEHTSPGWHWIITVTITGVDSWTDHVTVPDTATIDYPDLVKIDPDTLDEIVAPVPEWWAIVNTLIAAGGIPGEQGPKGEQGEKGDRGTKGEQGDKGDEGDAGDTGPAGPQGIKGDTGDSGPAGPAGIQGDTGAAGPAGIQGIQGSTGATGPKGDKGDKGDTGTAGTNGTSVTIKGTVATSSNLPGTGNTSGDGWITSNDGHLWVWGGSAFTDVGTVRGPTGLQGLKGDTGDTGATGAAGVQGIQGIQGIQGDTGAIGAQGPTGAQGVKGDTGDTGPQGLTGATGPGVPAGGTALQYVRKNAGNTATEWADIPTATTTAAGLMSAGDKTAVSGATAATTPSQIIKRDAAGAIHTAPATIGAHAIRKDQVDAGLAAKVAKGELFKNVRDYKLAGAADDNAAIIAAHNANPAVFYPDGDYNPGANSNLYNSTVVKNAIGPRWMAGRTGAPIADIRPIMWAQKHSNSTYGTDGWDQGAFYGALIKESGDSYGAAITGYAATFGGTGDTAGVHGRARIASDLGNGFGMWAYAHVTTPTPGRVVGLEVDVRNDAAPTTWAATGQSGAISGMVVALSDGTGELYGAHQGIRFPQRSSTNMQRFWTGLQFDNNTIMPTDVNGNGEAIRIRGADYAGGRYGGITLGDNVGSHYLTYGLRMHQANIANQTAVWLAKDHRIVFGTDLGTGAGTWITINAAGQLDSRNAPLAMNGTQVVTGRRTGWAVATGTATRTTFATSTVTLPQLAERVKAILDDLTTHGLIGT